MQSYPVKFLQSMLKMYSPSGSEHGLASLLRSEMAAQGFKTRRDRAGNIIGETGQEGPRVLLCGHMDTVPGELPVRVEGDFITGRGAVDAKSSLAAMMLGCARAMERSSHPFHATLAAVVEEETSSSGIKALMSENGRYDLAVFAEPSGSSNIIVGYKGSAQVHLVCMTHGGHSASPWLSKNSLEEAFEFWKDIKDSLLQNGAPSKFSALTGSLTKLEAGEQANSIPSRASMEIDLRIPPGITFEQVVERLDGLRRAFEVRRSGVRLLTSFRNETPAYLGEPHSLGVQVFRSAIRRIFAGQVALVRKTGTSDMNEFSKSHRIPMVAYGPGDSSLDHTDNEHVNVSEYLKSIEVYARAIERLASLARKGLVLPAA